MVGQEVEPTGRQKPSCQKRCEAGPSRRQVRMASMCLSHSSTKPEPASLAGGMRMRLRGEGQGGCLLRLSELGLLFRRFSGLRSL